MSERDDAPERRFVSPELERAVLGGLLDRDGAYALVRDLLTPGDFHDALHASLYALMADMRDRDIALDVHTVAYEAATRRIAGYEGAPTLRALVEATPDPAHVKDHARIVADLASRRRLLNVARRTQERLLSGMEEDAAALQQEARELFAGAVAAPRTSLEDASYRSVGARFLERLRTPVEQRPPSLATGLSDLDTLLKGGLRQTEFVVVGARPGLGKTALMLTLAHNMARDGRHVAIFSLEMPEDQLWLRMLALETSIPLSDVEAADPASRWYGALEVGTARLVEHEGHVFDHPVQSVADIMASVVALRERGQLDVVMVDYIQRVAGTGEGSRHQDVARIGRDLKSMARLMCVPVIALSQVNRAVDTRADHRPLLADLRECVTGDTTLIDGMTGLPIAIRNVTRGSSVMSLGPDQKVISVPVESVWSTGVKPVFTVRTRTGRQLRATANHPLLTADGWKSVGDLVAGDEIAVPFRLPSHGTQVAGREDMCRLLGYLVGDGTYQKHRAVGFISSDPDTFNDVASIVGARFPSVRPRMKASHGRYLEADFVCTYANGWGKPHGNPLREWLREIGVYGQRDSDKRIPAYVHEAGDTAIAHYLAGYLASDGCVKRRKNGAWEIHFDTVNRALAVDVQALLTRLGIVSVINNGYRSKKATVPLYRLSVASLFENVKRFATRIPVRGRKGALLARLLGEDTHGVTGDQLMGLPREISRTVGVLSGGRNGGWKDQSKHMRRDVCRYWAARLDSNALRMWAESDVMWDRIVGIEPDGCEEVFDISIPTTHNFIANGIVAHNSGDLEAEADAVLFPYREHAYTKTPEFERHAEIEVAKRRNGPTGRVQIEWVGDQTRFRSIPTDNFPF